MQKEIHTEEYFIASIDLLGAKQLIMSDIQDEHLNRINSTYISWKNAKEYEEFNNIEIKFFSDNVVAAIKSTFPNALDNLLKYVSNIFLGVDINPEVEFVKEISF